MNRPGTRFFIGPLTQAQQRRRERSRDRWRVVDEIAYARCIPVSDAFKAERDERVNRWAYELQRSGHPRDETR